MGTRIIGGSPPQVRGKPELAESARAAVRITPAGAGKTALRVWATSAARDHPRRCGENAYSRIVELTEAGSPPQVRGKPLQHLGYSRQDRITPAGAGKTTFRSRATCTPRDHPRRCGENLTLRLLKTLCRGSPPQVRGKPEHSDEHFVGSRITPAGAGKTWFCKNCLHTDRDHPRRCGENYMSDSSTGEGIGSPPQVRGKPVRRAGMRLGHGITPAGAGKTRHFALKVEVFWDHPRRCGENLNPCGEMNCSVEDHPRRCGENTAKHPDTAS